MKRIAGSPEGKAGYRDGHAEQALFNHPKNLAVDNDGNIYIADPKNFAIRKLSKTGEHGEFKASISSVQLWKWIKYCIDIKPTGPPHPYAHVKTTPHPSTFCLS